MNAPQFTALVRGVVARLDKDGTPKNAAKIVEPLREALRERGLGPRCHEGRKDLTLEQTPEQIVEWYAGQVVEVVDSRAWHTVNSVMNLCDKFVPKGDPT